MALLYRKYTEDNTVIYDFTKKTRWLVIFAILVGFILFITSIQLNSSSAYRSPMFLVSLPILLVSLGIAVIENVLYIYKRITAGHITIIKKGVVKLEDK